MADKRLRGEQVEIKLVENGAPVDTWRALASGSIECKNDILEEEFLGETAPRFDAIFKGWGLSLELQMESAAEETFVDAVRLTFNQPMVPLADVAALKAAPIPFTIEPAVPGEVDWLGTRTLAFVPEAAFTLVKGQDDLRDYQFNKHNIHHLFCKTCGVASFARGTRRDGAPMIAINVRCLDGFDLDVPAGSSIAIVGVNGAGKTTLAKLLCRLYDPVSGAIEVDGVPLTDLEPHAWRRRVTAVFQDYVRFELPLRANVAPGGAPDDVIRAALADAGAADLAGGDLDTILSKGYPGGTDLSGGQWQRVALARALCAVRMGAGVLLLDEPTAQLDVRGEAEIFDRILAATRDCTTILISHRFSTVRHADRICVLEHGRVVELGTHDELMAQGGRYRTMFDLQAQRFAEGLTAEGEAPTEEVALDA